MAVNWANKLTLLRMALIPLFLAAVLQFRPQRDYLRFVALGILLLAALLDVLDGYIARRLNQVTRIGALLDPLVDKMLIMGAFLCLYQVGAYFERVRFPLWLVVFVVLKDTVLLSGVWLLRKTKHLMSIHPSIMGKLTLASEIMAIAGVLLQWPHVTLIWYVILVLAVISSAGYISKGIMAFRLS